MLIIRGERPRLRVLRTDRHAAGWNGSTAVRQRRHRYRVLAKVREPPERLIPVGREFVIEAHIALILIDDFVGGPAVVVRGGGVGRERIALEKRQRDRIHGASRNRVVGKLLTRIPHRRGRIVDVLAEDTGTLRERRHVRGDRAADGLPLPLNVDKEKRPAFDDRAAEHAAVLIPAVVRFHRIAGLEVVPGVQVFVAEEFEHVAVIGVAAGLGCEIDHAAIEAPEFGRWAIALDFELLDGVDHRVVRDLARLRLQDRNAVEEIFVRSRSAAIDARQDGIRRQGDARNDGSQHDEQTAVQRQLHDLLVLDDRPEARGLRSHDRRIADDRHLFLNTADAEVKIDSCLFASRETNTLAPHGFEPRELDVEAVVAGRQARGGVDAIATGNGDSRKVRPYVGDGNRRAGNGRPGLIFHKAGDLARTRLSTGWQHTDKPRAYHRKADGTQFPSSHTDNVPGQVGRCISLTLPPGPTATEGDNSRSD